MDERFPDEPTSRAPAHPAPAEVWRPLSGLAMTAFVLSLVGILIAILGLWWVQAIAALIAVVALASLRSGARRGRGFAIAALAIAAPTAFYGYATHGAIRRLIRGLGDSVLSALKMDDEKALDEWLDRTAAEAGAAARIRERYRAVAAEVGPYEGEVDAGSPWTGGLTVLFAPTGAEEVGAPGKRPDLLPGTLWVRARFAKETLWVGLVLKSGRQEEIKVIQEDMKRTVSDVRFLRPPGSAPATR